MLDALIPLAQRQFHPVLAYLLLHAWAGAPAVQGPCKLKAVEEVDLGGGQWCQWAAEPTAAGA